MLPEIALALRRFCEPSIRPFSACVCPHQQHAHSALTKQITQSSGGDLDLFLGEVALQHADFLFQVFKVFLVVVNFLLLFPLISVALLLQAFNRPLLLREDISA